MKTKELGKKRTNITIDASLKAWLKYYADKYGMTQSQVIESGIKALKNSEGTDEDCNFKWYERLYYDYLAWRQKIYVKQFKLQDKLLKKGRK